MKKYYLGIFFIWIFLYSCRDSLGNFHPKLDITNSLVVEGGINGFQTEQYIKLSQISNSSTGSFNPIRNAKIHLKGNGITMDYLETSSPGIYRAKLPNKITKSGVFVINIQNGSINFQGVDTLYKGVSLKGTNFPFSLQKLNNGQVEITLPKHVFGQRHSYQWIISGPKDSLWSSNYFGNHFNIIYGHQFGIPNALYSLIGQSSKLVFNPTDSITIYKFNLSNQHGKYLYNLFQETDWKSFFSDVPVSVIGNISNNGQGFFSAEDVDQKKFKVLDLLGKTKFF